MKRAFALWLAACSEPPAPDPVPFFAAPVNAHQAALTVRLATPAPVAVRCARDDDPAEVHLLESASARTHVLPLGGLRAASTYDCVAVTSEGEALPAPLAARFFTPPAPADQVTATVTAHPTLHPTGAYTLTNVQPACVGGEERRQYLVMFDGGGSVRWRADLPDGHAVGIEVRYHGNGEIVWGGGEKSTGHAPPTVRDVFSGVERMVTFPGSDFVVFHHDGKRLPDGRYLTTESTEPGGVLAFQIRVIDPELPRTEWLFDSQAGEAAGWLTPSDPTDDDPYHLNFADRVETETGTIVIASLCDSAKVLGLDYETQTPRWILGENLEPRAPDGSPLGIGELPQCTHGLEFDGTHLLVYDNGQVRQESRAEEWTIDEVNGLATRDWMWTEPGWYESTLGDVDWLTPDRGRVLLTQAHAECFSTSPGRHNQILELDKASGEVVHRLVFDNKRDASYRSERIDGCAVFASTALCPALAARLDALGPRF